MTVRGGGDEAQRAGVDHIEVCPDEADLRLDRWFKRRFPHLAHGRLEKLLRTGQIRVDGKRAKARDRLAAGQRVRVPPLGAAAAPSAQRAATVSPGDAADLRRLVLYRDAHMIAINKPSGLAVQGGSGVTRHVDAMLEALRFDAPEAPRLVHRLDKDTSGVLLLARSASAATALTESFRRRATVKTYWALVVGVPSPKRGTIARRLAKRPGAGGEKVVALGDGGADGNIDGKTNDAPGARRAVTRYTVVETAGRRAAWLALRPITGRTHQLRVHAATLGTPIVGDGKYGGRAAFLSGVAKRLHLHSRSLTIAAPGGDHLVTVEAPLTDHMAASWKFFGFDEAAYEDPFATDT